ncbi:MAG: hypothetical protein C0494_12625 [Sphingobium sp.]|nr:hypothetical protein [Sphingobium sp.]
MKPLNYTSKAISGLDNFPCPGSPGVRQGLEYLIEKLTQAEVFLLPDCGELLDRAKPRPEIPSAMFKPPFDVVALEYEATHGDWGDSPYTATRSSRRISLAWDFQDDLPPLLAAMAPEVSRPGVAIASIIYIDQQNLWMPISGAMFVPYDGGYVPSSGASEFRAAMIDKGRLSKKQISALQPEAYLLPLLPEAIGAATWKMGVQGMRDNISADLMDEVNAYTDLCHILMCKNVRAERHPASRALNKARNKRSKAALKDFHVLTVDGQGEGEGGDFGGLRTGPRSHLRRGHIRRLSSDRVTWVNATMVNGHGGFVDKQYSVRAGQ